MILLCRNPFVRDKNGNVFHSKSALPSRWYEGIPFGCGKCLACRVKRRRDWTTRIALEALAHKDACFLTLTYDEDHVPWSFDSRTLDKSDLQNFMKRFRRHLNRLKERQVDVRYFACGEYGTRGTERPHYHLILFGVSDMDFDVIQAVDHAWREPAKKGSKTTGRSYGIWTLDPLTEKRVAYVAGYVMKKLIKPSRHYAIVDGKRVLDRGSSSRDENGTLAEFRLMSRRPGLGSGFIGDLVALWKSSAAFRQAVLSSGDVPSRFHHLGRTYYLDRFLKTKIREALGIEYDPTAFYEEMKKAYFEWYHNNALVCKYPTFSAWLVSLDDQRYKQLVDRVKRQLQRRSKI